ncbi:PIN domain-containing protein [Oerskovia turbata]|uniref:Ribonuclease VapC n=1 Tax=Oerskovia turbata TaxID=1713 RepID=A0A4Q1L0Z5_9CELL|nr:type II toxin-antitoxin system VapC family toxin [Oerskovia turbata]RXR27029.1 PIN domain-containing protein [Oerskovia turbata]RXR36403.1 PIN domain-containing protein [Oerskovia turbata]TGJ94600.1 PIN domain-containing protein [Actinotalea fermentans ATCC 43279 = JCM 9966 = DSM 3133]
MALVYFDASALVKLCVSEPGSELASALWNRADVVSTSRLADTEVRAALAAGERAGVLDSVERAQALATWERLWPALHLVEVSPEILDRASVLAGGDGHSLRGADAVHLASALVLRHEDAIFAVWDERVASAARAEALRVLP